MHYDFGDLIADFVDFCIKIIGLKTNLCQLKDQKLRENIGHPYWAYLVLILVRPNHDDERNSSNHFHLLVLPS